MAQIAIMTDSNSGITQEQAKTLGVSVLPMPFMIDGETFFEGVTLTLEEFFEKQRGGADIATSQPSPADVMKMWDELLQENEAVVHIPMSSGLSGSCETAMMLAQDYDGRVQVVNNQRISVTQRQSVLDAVSLAKNGKTAEEIKYILEKEKLNSSIYVMVDTLTYLKKGGRITPAVAALGTILRLKPVLQIQGDKLDTFAKARTVGQAKNIMLNAMRNDIENRFEGAGGRGVHLQIAHTENAEAAEALRQEIQEMYPDYDIYTDGLALSIACHIGPGCLAIASTQKLA